MHIIHICTVALLAINYVGLITANVIEEKLIGWRGEGYYPEYLWDPLNLTASQPDMVPLPASRSWVEQLSWKPRAYIYHNFLTPEEAHHLIKVAVPQMKRSTVVGEGGKSVEDGYRTSYGTFLRRYQDKVIERIENRVAAWTHIPVSHQEDIQVLRYGIGQFYKVHADTIRDEHAGVRVCTVLVYLNEPDEGGETAFPDSEWVSSRDAKRRAETDATFSDCAKGTVAFKPKRGDALLFWSIGPDGTTEDFHASHTGCPVISGVKWTITKWIHAKPFRPHEIAHSKLLQGQAPSAAAVRDADPGYCSDRTAQSSCQIMRERGDCENNRDMMVVSATGLGVCRKTCGACVDCAEGDIDCYNNNRKQVGYLTFSESELQPL